MSDLNFEIQVRWNGTGRDGEGQLAIGGEAYRCSAPENMGGKGVGVSPEDLLISAVASCYSGTLFSILQKRKLPARLVQVRAEGIVNDYPSQAKFSKIIVHPTVLGGDESKLPDYEKMAVSARNHCFIGKSIAGNIEYEVGRVQVVAGWMLQDQIDELVERFYVRLMKNAEYQAMFAERKVDIDVLKQRQKAFISRLVNPEQNEGDHAEVRQVQERHHFGVDPARSAIWIALMQQTMEEMQLEPVVKDPLLEKIRFLLNKMLESRAGQTAP